MKMTKGSNQLHLAIYFALYTCLILSGNYVRAQKTVQDSSFAFMNPKVERIGWFRELSYDIFGSRIYKDDRKALKRLLRDADDDQLALFVKNMEQTESDDKIEAIKSFPFIYYLLLGAWYDCHKSDESRTYRYYKIAKEQAKKQDNTFVGEEATLIKKIIKFTQRYKDDCLGIQRGGDEKDIFRHLENEATIIRDRWEQGVRDQQKISVEIKKELEPLQLKSIELGKEIARLEEEVKVKQVTIDNLSKENYDAALEEVKILKNRGLFNTAGTKVENLPGGAVLKAVDGFPGEPLNPQIFDSGLKLGEFCTADIRNRTATVLSSILEAIDFKAKLQEAPKDFKDSIFINLTITGKADGTKVARGPNGSCKLIYKDSNPIQGEYFLTGDKRFVNPIRVSFTNDSPICDNELAFLRTQCAYNELLNLFEGYGIKKDNVHAKFLVKVYEEKGDKYRGVDFDMKIENLFLHKMTDIRNKRDEKGFIDKKIAELKQQLKDNEKEIDKKKDPILREEAAIQKELKTIEDYKRIPNRKKGRKQKGF
ncbi:hypothetical protein [Runella sp.]|uniref:hypothetical protein n=1 Tax=Runella sp. TaxID=1960881 RepID=UPI00301A147E